MRKVLKIGLCLLIFVCATGTFYLKDSMFAKFLILAVMPGPDHQFNPGHAERAPDYTLKTSWIAHPGTEDNADWMPGGGRALSHNENSAYVFFIHPTAYLSNEHWIGTLDKNTATEENRQWIMANQATAYNGCCEIYAPYYREVSIATYFETDLDIGAPAIDFAYRDVARAFQSFLQQIPDDSPFIIASHSQGTLHGQRLLQQEIDGSTLHHRLVAAYLIGGTVHEHLFSTHYNSIHVCETASDVHCVIAFDTWREGVQADNSVPNWEGDRYVRNDDRWLCVNPLSWNYNEEMVSSGENPGSLPIHNQYNLYSLGGDVPAGLTWGPLDTPKKNIASARCTDGVLHTNNVETGLYDGQSWAGNYHSLDYALYYQSIRDNAKYRVANWWSHQAQDEKM
ncbi:MAG: DUF3089 domain-containing protein [Halioglobus sp.]